MHKPVYYEILGKLRELAKQQYGEKMLYSVSEVAGLLGKSRSSIYRMGLPLHQGNITLEALAERLV